MLMLNILFNVPALTRLMSLLMANCTSVSELAKRGISLGHINRLKKIWSLAILLRNRSNLSRSRSLLAPRSHFSTSAFPFLEFYVSVANALHVQGCICKKMKICKQTCVMKRGRKQSQVKKKDYFFRLI